MTRTGYWIVKGNPRYPIEGVDERCGDIVGFLEEQDATEWVTYKHIREDCKIGDRVFFWQSSPYLHIIGLGRITQIKSRKESENYFTIRHTQGQSLLKAPVGIEAIREAFKRELDQEEQDQAGYLKRSVVATLYKVTLRQASIIKKLIMDANPNNKTIQSWMGDSPQLIDTMKKLDPVEQREFTIPEEIPPEDTKSYYDGTLERITVNAYERNQKLRNACIQHYRREMGGRIRCYVCKFDFEARYREIGRDYIHVHHEIQLSLRREKHSPDPVREMKPLCANCHAMIHINPKAPLSVDELKRRLQPC